MPIALYRKYRPRDFDEVTGQDSIVQTLKNALKSERVSHAYLFSGERGTGKTTTARILAKAVNCLDLKDKTNPCGKCSSCLEIEKNQSIDLVEIDAASNRGIDEMRELKEGVRFSPVNSKFKIFIIDEAHMLTKEAFNALLKTLEEPPPHAIFILATTEPEKLPSTILSRVQRFNFKRLSINEIVEKLEKIIQSEKIKVSKEALKEIAQSAEGSFRDAESLLDQIISLGYKEIDIKTLEDILGRVDFATVSKFLESLSEKNKSLAIEIINTMYEKGVDLKEFGRLALKITRMVAVIKASPKTEDLIKEDLSSDQMLKIKELADKFSSDDLKKLLNEMIKIQELIKHSPLPTLPLELIVMSF